MSTINPYLNFDGTAEEAMNFYKSVLGGEFIGEMFYMKDAPGLENLSESERNRVMHVALQIGDNILMASDTLPSMGHTLSVGNNYYIALAPKSKEQADDWFDKLSIGGSVEMPISQQFFGYFGSLKDKYGIQWMINFDNTGNN